MEVTLATAEAPPNENYIEIDADELETMTEEQMFGFYVDELEGTLRPGDTRASVLSRICQLAIAAID